MSEVAWLPGQRVRNEGEPGLGLGIVTQASTSRTVSVYFPAVQENRTYSLASAPLRRFHLAPGQVATLVSGGSFRVEKLSLREDLLYYSGGGKTVCETELADRCTSAGPLERLAEGELSHVKTFDLRSQGWTRRSEMLSQRFRGLTGARVALMPHQLAIASKVSGREMPRVLLADEVGLGKTIEACMIYSMLRAVGRADRVLVLTPASLVHQWLTELYRRFNELFKVAHSELEPLVDESLLVGGEDEEGENPFEDASRIIAPIEMLRDRRCLEQALETPWDLLIVDEAHHLRWTPRSSSPEYRCVQALAQRSRGLLLLTATPLRQGLETQFALLHLVDPERFSRLEDFLQESEHLMEVGRAARDLADRAPAAAERLRALFPDDDDLIACLDEPSRALPLLVDRHGTGRVLVRNRRERLSGFPGRKLRPFPLPCPSSWRNAELFPEVGQMEKLLQKVPVTVGGGGERSKPTLKDDPRWTWTVEWIRALEPGTKVVVMAARVKSVLRLEKFFRQTTGLKVAVFHEELSLIERDRQAAYFAEDEGAQVLLCSEIGGEGRNFQFCHHLLLFDLPLHPDALEQRIGRLDRIGQTQTIEVAVPYIEDTPSEVLFHWHQLLGVFEAPLPSGDPLMDRLQDRLWETLQAFHPRNPQRKKKLEQFLAHTREVLQEHLATVQQNVDFLVDLNSYDQALGQALADEIVAAPTEPLQRTMSELLEHFGVVEEELATPGLLKIKAGDLMKVEPFPGLREGGYLATYDRSQALAREEVQFLSIDHPLVEGSLGLLLDQAEGKACTGLWEGAPEQTVAVQFLYLLQAVGPARLELHRYLPPQVLVVTVDMRGNLRQDLSPPERLQSLGVQLWNRLAGPMLQKLPQLQDTAAEYAQGSLGPRLEQALVQAREHLSTEQRRLEYLALHNNVSQAELKSHQGKLEEALDCLRQARVELDAIRVLVLDPRA